MGLGGVGLTTLAVGLTHTYYSMLVILVIMGIFAGAYHPSALSTLSASFEETRRGKVIALHVVGGSIGFTVGPIFGGLIAELLGWRFAFIILSLPALAAVPVILKKFRQLELQSSAKSHQQPSRPAIHSTSIWQALRAIGIIFALAVLIHLIAGSAMAFMPVYLVDKHHVAPAYAAMMMGILRGGGIAGSLFGGWLSDRWDRKKAIFLSLIVVGPILYLFTQLPFNAGLIVVLLTFGILRYMTQSTIQPFLMDNVPPQLRATMFGIYFGLSMEGMSLAQPVAGHFMDIFGIAEVFTVIALISVGLSLAALLLARKA